MVCEYTYDPETKTIRVNCLGCLFGSSIEDFPICFATTISKLLEVKDVDTVVLAGDREYEYDYAQTKLLVEIANVIDYLVRVKKVLSINNLSVPECDRCVSTRLRVVQNLMNLMRQDPIGSYVEILREIRHVKVRRDRAENALCKRCYDYYLTNALKPMRDALKKTKLIKMAKPYLAAYKVGDRNVYRQFFHPVVRPNFMYTRYMTLPPERAEVVERYNIDDIKIEIYKKPGSLRYIYHIIPPEFKLSEEEYTILDTSRRYLAEHRPSEASFANLEKLRATFYNIGRDMIQDLTTKTGLSLSGKKIDRLANILVRYTAGLGILELLLSDNKVQDIYINSPIGTLPVYIYHSDYEECQTNLIPSVSDAEAWATRFRLNSGRPLDEANPILDTELTVPGGRARVAVITRSLSPSGLAFALRRHRDRPWTYPLFIKNKMLNPLAAGLMWFLIDNARTLLIAGNRSSGKTSLLGASMIQIMRDNRIVTLEDTLELPFDSMKDLGYNIERLKSRSVITRVETELPAEEALRAALRLGDSCLIVGEVRSVEAKALYEAMRIGALANVVAGTIHGESAYGVFDRVVNDLGVPPTSFKATDFIIICNMLRSPDGVHRYRRMVELTEVRKHWKEDPLEEQGFVNLLEYSAKMDALKPTNTLLTGESVIINDISKRIKEWGGNWDAVWNNINLRANIMKTIVKYGEKNPNLLEAEFVVNSNSRFHLISNEVKEELGTLDSKEIFDKWSKWLKKEVI
ncbi:MAG: ATPase, T2SS/T4P/T4SS family [Candidatus Thorarchaeota archaeon]